MIDLEAVKKLAEEALGDSALLKKPYCKLTSRSDVPYLAKAVKDMAVELGEKDREIARLKKLLSEYREDFAARHDHD